MTYEYVCSACGARYDVEQRITDPAEVECRKCHQRAVRRLASGGLGFVLKGSRWARDGYG